MPARAAHQLKQHWQPPARAEMLRSCAWLALAALALCAGTAADSVDCEAKGFTGLGSCSDCDLFAEIVKDEELAADCKACCVKDAAAVRYAKATLEVCPFKKKGLPQIADFIAKHSQQFGKRLVVRESPHSYPRLILSNPGKGGERSSVRIDGWNVATIVEYLRDKLLPVNAGDGGGGSSGGKQAGGGGKKEGGGGDKGSGGGGAAEMQAS